MTALAFVAVITASAGAATLEDVTKKGVLRCGVSQGLPGFSNPGKDGKWRGFDVDFCRAVAAATLGDSEKVAYVPVSEKERFPVLRSGEIDLLVRNTTYSLMRDAALELNFAGVNYFDGQGFLVRKDLNVKSAMELGGATVCVTIGTTTELNLADFFRVNKMEYTPLTPENANDAARAYDEGRCDAYTTDQSALAAMRLTLKKPADHMILPDVISKEPLGPAVRHGDDQWLDIVKWTHFVMLEAEEYGVSMETVDQMKKSKLPVIRRLLGIEGNLGEYLGLDNEWAYRIIKQVGNYGETFERNLGRKTPLKLPRGLNKLWKNGGLQYAMPVR